MACINPDGTLSTVARAVLICLRRRPADSAGLARETGLPLFRIRATLRETAAAELVRAMEEDAGLWTLTALGAEALDLDAA